MELFSPSLKFFLKKKNTLENFLKFSQKKVFLYFLIELSSPMLKKLKFHEGTFSVRKIKKPP